MRLRIEAENRAETTGVISSDAATVPATIEVISSDAATEVEMVAVMIETAEDSTGDPAAVTGEMIPAVVMQLEVDSEIDLPTTAIARKRPSDRRSMKA